MGPERDSTRGFVLGFSFGELQISLRYCACLYLEPGCNLRSTVYTFVDSYIVGSSSLRQHLFRLKTFTDSLIVPREMLTFIL